MEIMIYADDTQLYTSLTDASSTTQLENFERCLMILYIGINLI